LKGPQKDYQKDNGNEPYDHAQRWQYHVTQLGLGLMRFGSEAETASVFRNAVTAGYRLFDSAAVYGNEREVGEGLRSCGVEGRASAGGPGLRCQQPV
jgi:diketogulonate reductase-like aldo/keto reductase